jgi:hypothetical protein
MSYHDSMETNNPIMNTNNHPIDLFIVLLLDMFKGICWLINEANGHHTKHTVTITPFIQPFYSLQLINPSDYTVKQLRKLTGITNSRYRKAGLLQQLQATVCVY